MNDLSLQVGDQVQMTEEGRRLFKPPYTGVIYSIGTRGGLNVLGFGEKKPRSYRPRFWRKLGDERSVDAVECPICGKSVPAAEMDECVGCSRPYEICPDCMAFHECGKWAVKKTAAV